MINYAKHDEEFYGIFKLNNGEEIVGKAVLTDDQGETLVFISNPVVIESYTRELDSGKISRGMGFSHWMQMSDEEFFILREKDIIAIASMSKEVRFMYESFIGDEDFDPDSFESQELKESNLHIKPDTKMGYLGKVEEARKLFERIYKS